MKTLIVYGSQYGTAQRYASELSKLTGFPVISHKEVQGIDDYEKVIYVGALYAGSVLGLKKFAKTLTHQELTVVTVGIVDPNDPENIRYIRQMLKKQLPERFYDETKIFHLRGAIDYNHLNLKHRLMMSFVHRQLDKRPLEQLDVVARTIIETYGKTVDYVDFGQLNIIY